MYKTTSELRQGDVVLNHGMRILLDEPARVHFHEGVTESTVYAWPGLVLNADELCDPASPSYDAYIHRHLRGVWWEDQRPRPRKDQWIVQGNDLARWFVGQPWREDGTLFEDDGDHGGDIQSGRAYSRRFVHTKLSGRLFTVYAYPVTGDGTFDDLPEGVTRLEVQTELMVCTDTDEPGGTEVWSDIEYSRGDDLPEAFDVDYASVEEAERAARRYVETFDVDRAITWDGYPELGPVSVLKWQDHMRANSAGLVADAVAPRNFATWAKNHLTDRGIATGITVAKTRIDARGQHLDVAWIKDNNGWVVSAWWRPVPETEDRESTA